MALVLAACSDSLVSGHYRGTPLFSVDGSILALPSDVEGVSLEPRVNPRVALYWNGENSLADPAVDTVATQDVETRLTLPAHYTLDIFEPPPDALFTPSSGDAAQARALIVMYEDADGDAHWDREEERIIGVAPMAVLVYTRDDSTLPEDGGERTSTSGTGRYRLISASAISMPCGSTDDGKPEEQAAPAVSTDIYVLYDDEVSAELLPPDLDCDGDWMDWGESCDILLDPAVYEAIVPEEEERTRRRELCEAGTFDYAASVIAQLDCLDEITAIMERPQEGPEAGVAAYLDCMRGRVADVADHPDAQDLCLDLWIAAEHAVEDVASEGLESALRYCDAISPPTRAGGP